MLTYYSEPNLYSFVCSRCSSVPHTNKWLTPADFRGLEVEHLKYAQVFQVFQNKIVELLSRQKWRFSAAFHDYGGETPCQ